MKRLAIALAVSAALSGCVTAPESVDFEIGLALGEFRADQSSGAAEMEHFVFEQLDHSFQLVLAARDEELARATKLAAQNNILTAGLAVMLARKYSRELFSARDANDYNRAKFGSILNKQRRSAENMVELLVRERAKARAVRQRVDSETRTYALRAATDILAAAQAANPVEDEPEVEPEPTEEVE